MSIDRAALPFVTGEAALAAVLVATGFGFLALPVLAFLAFTLWFFRDPARSVPDDPGALLAPADGRIIRAAGDTVSIFMNVFNVHVCRTPVAGTVLEITHTPGRFLAAFKDDAPTANERTRLVVGREGGPVEFTLIAGLVARRIVCRARVGEKLAAGDRVGLIRFGSRVDVKLPPGAVPAVRVGDRVVAGITVVARSHPSVIMTAPTNGPP